MVEQLVVHLDQIWSSLEDLCSTFTPEEWALQTDCPGWTVHDQLAHMSGTESSLLGRPAPEPIAKPWPAHVRDEFGARNEAQIEMRRSWAPEDVLTEFMEVTAERLKVLTDMTPQEWESETTGFTGQPVTMRERISVRVLDCLYHEQDIRRATENPGNLDGPPAEFVFGRMAAALPFIVAKRAGAPPGTSVVFEVAGPIGGTFGVEVGDDGRGRLTEKAPSNPTTTIETDAEAFLCFTGGRWTRERAAKDGRVAVEGDEALGGRVLGSMAVTP